jgi:NmrA-like family
MRPDQAMQFVAVCDVGRVVARIFGDPDRYVARTIEMAGDSLTGVAIAEKFSAAAARPITHRRFAGRMLEETPFLAGLAALVDQGRLAGHADIEALSVEFPGMLKMDDWLRSCGRQAFSDALLAGGPMALRYRRIGGPSSLRPLRPATARAAEDAALPTFDMSGAQKRHSHLDCRLTRGSACRLRRRSTLVDVTDTGAGSKPCLNAPERLGTPANRKGRVTALLVSCGRALVRPFHS